MQSSFECVRCIINQMFNMIGLLDESDYDKISVTKKVLAAAEKSDFSKCPPKIAKSLYQALSEITGISDPYKTIKISSNNSARSVVEKLKFMIENTKIDENQKFNVILNNAINGNIIDFGAHFDIDDEVINSNIEFDLKTLEKLHNSSNLKKDIENAETILYICDNSGEIMFDSYFIQNYMKSKNVYACVRGGPAINDALKEDAVEAGLDEFCTIIDTGDNIPGVNFANISSELVDAFEISDLVILKGQGNLETVYDENTRDLVGELIKRDFTTPMYFLLKIKCNVVESFTNFKKGESAIIKLK